MDKFEMSKIEYYGTFCCQKNAFTLVGGFFVNP